MLNSPQNCYWFIDESETIRAMCTECHEKNEIGWYWNGKECGYGDYDLNCHVCDRIINKRNND